MWRIGLHNAGLSQLSRMTVQKGDCPKNISIKSCKILKLDVIKKGRKFNIH